MSTKRVTGCEAKTIKLCLIVYFVLLLQCILSQTCKRSGGNSPSVVAPVCQVGDQLEVICNVTGRILRWEFTVFLENGAPMTFMPTISSGGSSGVPPPVMANSTSFTYSRLSTQPLTSSLTINPVSEGLNGVQVSCEDVEASESATTTTRTIDTHRLNPSIQSHSEQFSRNRVTVVLEWTITVSQIYYRELLPKVSVVVSPNFEVTTSQVRNMNISLMLQYNTQYNVSIIQPGICGQLNQTAFILLNYSRCSNPMALTQNNIQVIGYEDPALEGEVIRFICPPGYMLNGSNSSMCMGNGEWEPDPREVNCCHVKADQTICGHPQYVLQIKDSITIMSYKEFRNSDFNNHSLICCSGILAIETNTTTCLEEELNTTTQLKYEGCVSDMVSDTLRTELISVSCVLILAAALMLIIGFVSGHCFSQRYRKRGDRTTINDATTPNPTKERMDELELSKNVAYITLRPR